MVLDRWRTLQASCCLLDRRNGQCYWTASRWALFLSIHPAKHWRQYLSQWDCGCLHLQRTEWLCELVQIKIPSATYATCRLGYVGASSKALVDTISRVFGQHQEEAGRHLRSRRCSREQRRAGVCEVTFGHQIVSLDGSIDVLTVNTYNKLQMAVDISNICNA